jgi:hypothetical protein
MQPAELEHIIELQNLSRQPQLFGIQQPMFMATGVIFFDATGRPMGDLDVWGAGYDGSQIVAEQKRSYRRRHHGVEQLYRAATFLKQQYGVDPRLYMHFGNRRDVERIE